MITIYGTSNCAGCRDSKKYLESKGIDYEYIELNSPETIKEFQMYFPGKKTVPQILFFSGVDNPTIIGGYEDLLKLL